MRYITRDGLQLDGAGAAEIIDGLRQNSKAPGRDRTEFLEILARGARLQTGAFVRVTDCASTLADLETAGLIERLPDNG
jgi:hypothetical protein